MITALRPPLYFTTQYFIARLSNQWSRLKKNSKFRPFKLLLDSEIKNGGGAVKIEQWAYTFCYDNAHLQVKIRVSFK